MQKLIKRKTPFGKASPSIWTSILAFTILKREEKKGEQESSKNLHFFNQVINETILAFMSS
jgi:hypothetical protein